MPPQTTQPVPAMTRVLRMMSDLICLHGLCSRPACRRRRACSGEPRDCLSRYAPLVPEDAREGAKAMIAAKWRDRSFEELIDEAPDEVMALADWANAVARSGRPRCGWDAD